MLKDTFSGTNLGGLRADYAAAQTFVSTKFDSTGQMLSGAPDRPSFDAGNDPVVGGHNFG